MRTTTRRTPTRGVLAVIASIVLGGVLASPASAHTELLSSTPGAGSTVGAGVTDLTLTFSTPLVAEGTQILVRDSGGTNHASVPSTLGSRSRVRLTSLDAPGTYSVVYRAVAGDGHPVSGTYEFQVSGAVAPVGRTAVAASDTTVGDVPGGSPVAAAVPEGTGSPVSGWLFAGLGASSLAALLIAGARRRPEDERRPADDDRP